MELIVTTTEKLTALIEDAMLKVEEKKKNKEAPKLLSINQVAKMLGRSHSTIKNLAAQGILKRTKDGMIHEDSINDYLKG